MCLNKFKAPKPLSHYFCLENREPSLDKCPPKCINKVIFPSGSLNDINSFNKECINLKLLTVKDERVFICILDLQQNPSCATCPPETRNLIQGQLV